MAKPKFYLEPRPTPTGHQAINMFYSFSGQRLQYYTGIRVNIKYFRPECNKSDVIQPIKTTAPSAVTYNQRLKDIRTDAIRLVNETKGEHLTVKNIREQLDFIYKPKVAEPEKIPEFKHTFISYYEMLIANSKSGKRMISSGKNKGKKFTHNAIKNYSSTLSAVKRYLTYNNKATLSLYTINKEFYENFRTYIFDVEKKEISTFAGYIKDIKTVMIESKTPGFNTKEFHMPSYEADTIALSLEQIDKIHSLDLSDKRKSITHLIVSRDKDGKAILTNEGERILKPEKISYAVLDNIRDLFLTGCYSGLRFSDVSNLSVAKIENGFIRIKQVKTGARVTIPIMQRFQKVLDKYEGALPRSVSNQQFNRIIKEVVKLAGLTNKVSVRSYTGNIESYSEMPLNELVSSHTARRSYATNMFKAGVPPMLIMSATGHKTESSFLKYIRANNEDKAKLLAETLQKLGL